MSQKFNLAVVASSVFIIFVVRLYLDFRRLVRLHNDFSGLRTIISAHSFFGRLTRAINGVAPGASRAFLRKHEDFKYFGQDAFINVSAFPSASAICLVSDAAAIKDIVASRHKFPKPTEEYKILSIFGNNIVTSESDDWKRYRKICAPAFNEKNFHLVWEETVKNSVALFQNVWGQQDKVEITNCMDFAMSLALFVLASAGFGRHVSWGDENMPPLPGHKMTFKNAISNATHGILIRLVIPDRVIRWAPTRNLETLRDAFDDFYLYMDEMVKDRLSPGKTDEKSDLLSRLVDANDVEGEEGKLTETEMIGNMFIFLVAGHESSTNTLCFTMALLALYPDEQEALFEHVQSVLGDGRIPKYEDMTRLNRVLAVIYETLRLFPPVAIIPKVSATDTTIVVGNEAGERVVVPIAKGTLVDIHVPGLHYNPRYWKDPHAFKPSRFLGDWPKDAFIPFSGGPRACVGRRFFEVFGVAFISLLISRYKVEVIEEAKFKGETFEEKRARVTDWHEGINTSPVRVPLVFKRR